MRIFYSWQSDLPNSTNRGLIQAALTKAASEIASDGSIDVEPVVDRDTDGEPGAPDIAATIFEKISKSDAVVCDVSVVTPSGQRRQSPNPNVLVELGYAVGVLGWRRVILVVNTAYGPVESLPFDLRTHRILAYESRPDDTSRSGPRKELQRRLEGAIRLIASYPADDRSRKLSLGYPDIRVKVMGGTVYEQGDGPYMRPNQRCLRVTVQNHSPLPLFLESIVFELDDGRFLFPRADVVLGFHQQPQRVEPGDAISLHVSPESITAKLDGHALRRVLAVDRIGRRFFGDDVELAKAFSEALEPIEGD